MTGQTTGRLLSVLAIALLAGLMALLSLVAPAETLPGGFSDTKFAAAPLPTALAFTPDGRMLVTSKSGELYLYDENGDRIPNAASGNPWALKLSVCGNSERGLLGVAVDPDFEINNYIYLYYTNKRAECPDKEPGDPGNPYNRVSRFTMNGDTIIKESEKVLIDGIPSPNGNHNGGDLHFGNDEKLYVSVGDGACDYAEKTRCQYENDASRDNHVLLGKILRINPDGTIPEDNPYAGRANSARCSPVGSAAPGEIARTEAGDFCEETFVKGFRNPFRFAVDPDAEGTRLFINDVGGQRWEEVDEAVFGANNGDDYGWNICEGRHDNPYRGGQENCDSATKTAPIHEYNHSTGCESVTAGAFVPDGSNWPDEYKDDYLYGDFVCGKIFSLSQKQDGSGYASDTFIGGLGIRSAVAMTFGPHKDTQALYYATFEGNGGSIRRVAYTEGNQAPVADLKTVGDNYGDADAEKPDFQIDFDASGTRDPENNTPLEYMWDFDGNGTVDETTPESKVTHTYTERKKYTATLTVKDSPANATESKVSEPATLDVFPGNEPPEPSITQIPATFQVGETYTASGAADDPDGDEPVTLSWEVAQVHDNNHEHPAAEPQTGPDLTFKGQPAEGLYSTDPQQNYLVVRLTATDSEGLSKTVEQIVRPDTVPLTFRADPSMLKIRVGGEQVRGQDTVTAWVRDGISVTAPRQQDRYGRVWAFKSWSDGGPATHTVISPEDPKTYTAAFKRVRR
jgi:glucose/arabinose dehydrogenase